MKTIDTYHRWIEWSEEDSVYLGRCPDLISGIHGNAPVTLYADLTQIVQEVIDHHHSTGKPLPPPRSRPIMNVG
ncbi:MAG: pilus assembly protein HicB [Planctomycetota bacterium]